MNDLQKILLEILKSIIPKDKKNKIEMDSELVSDLGCDSVMLIRLVVELEKKAGYDPIKASDEVDFTEIKKVEDVLSLITKYNKYVNQK